VGQVCGVAGVKTSGGNGMAVLGVVRCEVYKVYGV